MRLGTLVHNTTLMSKPQLQVCKQQTASGNKTSKLTFLPITWFSDNDTGIQYALKKNWTEVTVLVKLVTRKYFVSLADVTSKSRSSHGEVTFKSR